MKTADLMTRAMQVERACVPEHEWLAMTWNEREARIERRFHTLDRELNRALVAEDGGQRE